MRVVLLGKPDSGKGTQAKRLAAQKKIPAISTGDLIRTEIAASSPHGLEFQSYTANGHLVPDTLVMRMVEQRLGRADCAQGFLFDGFPRTLAQAQGLEELLGRTRQPLDLAIDIVVPDAALFARAAGRRFCAKDGFTFHVHFAPPKVEGRCDQCGGPLAVRGDDQEAVVRERLVEYVARTAPVSGFYRGRGLLREVEGLGTPEEVWTRLSEVVNSAGS